jgi:modulator of FtsH protease HflK
MTARRGLAIGLLVGLTGYLGTGLTIIPQDEVGVVRRFGSALREPWPPGLHLALPWGMDRVDRLARDRARTVSVGARGLQSAPLSRAPDPDSDDFLTGDLNLVTAQAQVQFRVVSPIDYLFEPPSADAAVSALAESALSRALAARAIDDVLTAGRAEVSEQIRREVQAGADAQELGVSIRAVRLARVAPPTSVAPAFADASRARSDRRQVVTRAEEYRDRALADARGLARETLDRAEGKANVLVQSARGDASRFTKLLAEVRKNPRAARERIYLDTLAELLPKFKRKVVVAPGQDLDLSLITDP